MISREKWKISESRAKSETHNMLIMLSIPLVSRIYPFTVHPYPSPSPINCKLTLFSVHPLLRLLFLHTQHSALLTRLNSLAVVLTLHLPFSQCLRTRLPDSRLFRHRHRSPHQYRQKILAFISKRLGTRSEQRVGMGG